MRSRLLFLSFLFAVPVTLLASVDSQLLGLVPPGTKMVAAIDVTHSQASTAGQHLLSHFEASDDQLQQLIAETGFDPRRDLQSVLFAGSGSLDGEGQPGQFIVLARGIFDQTKIKAATQASRFTVRSFNGIEMIETGQGSKHKTALAFPSSDIAVLGDLTTVEAVLNLNGSYAPMSTQFQQEIQKVGTDNDAWFVSQGGTPSAWNHLINAKQDVAAQAKVFDSVLLSYGGIRLGDGLQASFGAITRSQQDALSLVDVVRLGASLVQMERQNDADASLFASALDKMNITANGNSMHLSFSLPEKDLEQLVASASGPVSRGRDKRTN